MAARRTERLLNLVICLLSTRRYLSKDEIRHSVQGYSEGQDAFERAFERDKEELRELGIPLEVGTNNPLFDDELGYRIRRDAYELPPISFAPDELAVLGLAARFWQQASLAEASSRALVKLTAEHPDETVADLAGIEPRLVRDEPGFDELWQAVTDRCAVQFAYRTREGAHSVRHLEPWGMVAWHGRWYVAGHDRDRRAARVFRLGRVSGPVTPVGRVGEVQVPPGVDVRAMVRGTDEDLAGGVARLRVAAGAGGGLRRQATGEPVPDLEHAGWTLLDVPYEDIRAIVDDVVGYGPAAVVVDPPAVRDAVRERLTGVLAAAAGPATGGGS